jgi:hypothetical protein
MYCLMYSEIQNTLFPYTTLKISDNVVFSECLNIAHVSYLVRTLRLRRTNGTRLAVRYRISCRGLSLVLILDMRHSGVNCSSSVMQCRLRFNGCT